MKHSKYSSFIFTLFLFLSFNELYAYDSMTLKANLTTHNPYLVIGSNSQEDAHLVLKDTDLNEEEDSYSIGLTQSVFEVLYKTRRLISLLNKDLLQIDSENVMVKGLKIKKELQFNSVNQYKLYAYDYLLFGKDSFEMDYTKITNCNNKFLMLGGYCKTSKDELTKKYKDLPEHNFIRIEAKYHFVGNWENNSGYLKADDNIVWTGRCKNFGDNKDTSEICEFPICRLNEIIKVTLKHSASDLTLTFGSTLKGNPCEQSYGISDINIYLK